MCKLGGVACRTEAGGVVQLCRRLYRSGLGCLVSGQGRGVYINYIYAEYVQVQGRGRDDVIVYAQVVGNSRQKGWKGMCRGLF